MIIVADLLAIPFCCKTPDGDKSTGMLSQLFGGNLSAINSGIREHVNSDLLTDRGIVSLHVCKLQRILKPCDSNKNFTFYHGVRKKDGGRTSSYKVVNAKRIRQMALVSMWMVNFNAMN